MSNFTDEQMAKVVDYHFTMRNASINYRRTHKGWNELSESEKEEIADSYYRNR